MLSKKYLLSRSKHKNSIFKCCCFFFVLLKWLQVRCWACERIHIYCGLVGQDKIWLCVSHQALVLSGDQFINKDLICWVGNLTQQTLKMAICQSATWILLAIQSAFSWQQALRKASSTRLVLVRWRCTRKKRTLETRYALDDSAGRREC